MPDVVDRQIDEEIVVGLPHLKKALTTGDVVEEGRGIAPDGVGGRHVHRGVELPPGPRIILGAIAGAVEEHVVDARDEHQVHVGLALREAGAEMLGEPGERLAAHQRLTTDVSCAGGIFQDGEVGIVFLANGVHPQPLDAEGAESEALTFGDIVGGVGVDEVRGTAVSLSPRDGALPVCPFRPLPGEVLVQQLAQRLTIVADDAARGLIGIVRTDKLVPMLFQFISATAGELFQERRRPVSTIHLVRVVEEIVRHGRTRLLERFADIVEIAPYGILVVMVHHPSFSTRGSALHLLACLAHLEGHARVSILAEDGLARRVAVAHRRASEGPPRACAHVDADADILPYVLTEAQHLHPLWGEEGDVVRLIALHAVDGGNLQFAQPSLGIRADVPFQILFVHRTTQPPPAGCRLSRRGNVWPCLGG